METTFGSSQVKDNKSPEIISFFTALEEMLDSISQAFKNRTPALNGEKYLTNRDVSKQLHMSIRTLQELRDSGKIPFIQIKGTVLYRQSDVMRLLEQSYFKSFI